MKILVLTNLYPPQELGGYGRSMADFVWGLQQRGHTLHVISSDAPYLGPDDSQGPSGEAVHRTLALKGSYEGGVKPNQNLKQCQVLSSANATAIQKVWDKEGPFAGVLVGNIDLLGIEILKPLLNYSVSVLHHIGFVSPPFSKDKLPSPATYKLVGASKAVTAALRAAELMHPTQLHIPVVYPGVRCELFGEAATSRRLPVPLSGATIPLKLGTTHHPLKVCFAGLLMGSKGAHTLVQALVLMRQKGYEIQGQMAGGSFQAGYREELESILHKNGLMEVYFTGQISRASLARCFGLHHVCVFPSIHPEAFGIVGAEAMASGILLLSSGVGGAAELFQDNVNGMRFQANNPDDLATKLEWLCLNPNNLVQLAKAGQKIAREHLNVLESARQLEELLIQ